MRFNVTILDDQEAGFSHLQYDTCKYLCHAIESAGYDCRITQNQLFSDAINIVLNSFRLHSLRAAESLKRKGDYVVLQSEMLSQHTINHWPDDGDAFAAYVKVLQGARAVWEGMPANLPILEEIGVQAELFRGGYHPQMKEIAPRRSQDIDFLFYGSLSPHRMEQLEKLAARGYYVEALTYEPAIFRNDCIARAKVHLAPWHSAELNQHLAWGRICYLLNNRGLVVVERVPDQEWLEDCFVSAVSDQWVEACVATLERPDREDVAQSFFERFQQKSFTDVVRRLIEKL